MKQNKQEQVREKIKMSKVSENGTFLFEWDFEVYPGKIIEFVKTKNGRLGYKETSLSQSRQEAVEKVKKVAKKYENGCDDYYCQSCNCMMNFKNDVIKALSSKEDK